MSSMPTIPKEQRSFADLAGTDGEDSSLFDRRDRETGVQSGQPGDAVLDQGKQGRYGDLKQNFTTHRQVEERQGSDQACGAFTAVASDTTDSAGPGAGAASGAGASAVAAVAVSATGDGAPDEASWASRAV